MHKVGDIVKVLTRGSNFFGQSGRITSVDYQKVNLVMEDYTFVISIESSDIEKINTKSTTLFKLKHYYV